MNIIIIGCSRVGRLLAVSLDKLGYDVAVIDRDQKQLEMLADDFSGMVIHGISIDRDVLSDAGCENADVVLVVTPDDYSNIMTSYMVREYFGVETIYTRIMDPELEEIYRGHGFNTISSTRMVSDAVLNKITGNPGDSSLQLGNSLFRFYTVKADRSSVNRTPDKLKLKPGELLFGVQKRSGKIVLANQQNLRIEDSDLLIFAALNGEGGNRE